MDTSTFKPQVWTSPTAPTILVCGNRWAHSAPSPANPKNGKTGHTFSICAHPVAIVIVSGTVMFNYTGPDTHTEWDSTGKPEDYGLSTRCAALVLAECYRAITWRTDGATLGYVFSFNLKKFSIDRNKAIMRNVAIYLAWDKWNREKLPLSARCTFIQECGYSLTDKALKRVMENAGLSI